MNAETLRLVRQVYEGSDGDATKRLYAQLEQLGPVGVVATNLFRAQKTSARAKEYRGGVGGRSYRGMSYGRKEWSIRNVCDVLLDHGQALGLTWGWQRDPTQPVHAWVLYVDLPTGQVSFHAAQRGDGPDYRREWDGKVGVSPDRIIRWCASLLHAGVAQNESTGSVTRRSDARDGQGQGTEPEPCSRPAAVDEPVPPAPVQEGA